MISSSDSSQDSRHDAPRFPLKVIPTSEKPSGDEKLNILLLKLPQPELVERSSNQADSSQQQQQQQQQQHEPSEQPTTTSALRARLNTLATRAKTIWQNHLSFPALPELPADQPITKWEKCERFFDRGLHIAGSTLLVSAPIISALGVSSGIHVAISSGLRAAAICLLPTVAAPILIAGPALYYCWRARKSALENISEMLKEREYLRKNGPRPPLFTKQDLHEILETFGLRKISVPEGAKLAELSRFQLIKLQAQQIAGALTFSGGVGALFTGMAKGIMNIPFSQHLPFLQEMGKVFGTMGYMFSGVIAAVVLTTAGSQIAKSAWKKHFSILPSDNIQGKKLSSE